jgi:hypothetical protein
MHIPPFFFWQFYYIAYFHNWQQFSALFFVVMPQNHAAAQTVACARFFLPLAGFMIE